MSSTTMYEQEWEGGNLKGEVPFQVGSSWEAPFLVVSWEDPLQREVVVLCEVVEDHWQDCALPALKCSCTWATDCGAVPADTEYNLGKSKALNLATGVILCKIDFE